jgi:ferrous iron transport protein B
LYGSSGGWRYIYITFGYMLALGYVAAFATYHVAVVLGAG